MGGTGDDVVFAGLGDDIVLGGDGRKRAPNDSEWFCEREAA